MCGVSSCCAKCWFLGEVLAEELNDLKQRRAAMRAANRALAKQEKNMKKRRARLGHLRNLNTVAAVSH